MDQLEQRQSVTQVRVEAGYGTQITMDHYVRLLGRAYVHQAFDDALADLRRTAGVEPQRPGTGLPPRITWVGSPARNLR